MFGRISCVECGADNPADNNFCKKCGKPLSRESLTISENRWMRRKEDFATRVNVDELEGALKKGLFVEHGTKALLFVNGKYVETLEPGRHDIGGLSTKFKAFDMGRSAVAVLVSMGDFDLDFFVSDLLTKDSQKVDVTCRFVLKLKDPNLFLVNLMQEKEHYTLINLKDFLLPEVRNAVEEAIGEKSVESLPSTRTLKEELALSVETHLKRTFERKGLDFVHVRAFLSTRGKYGEIREKAGVIFIEEKELELSRKKVALFDEMARLANTKRMNEVKSEIDLEKFIHEVDKDRILRKEEKEEFIRAFAEKKEDHEVARKHLVDKILLEQRLERERIEIAETRTREKEAIDHEIAIKKKLNEAQIIVDREQFTIDIQKEEKKLELASKAMREMMAWDQEEKEAQNKRRLAILKEYKDIPAEKLEVILASSGKKGKRYAKVLREKYKAKNMEELYKRLDSVREEDAKKLQELMLKNLETMKEVAVAASSGRQPVGGWGQIILCRKCHNQVTVQLGMKACPFCQTPFYD